MQVPDAVYHLMRHTELKSCDLSGNVITKIPPKLAVKFSLITGQYNNITLFIIKSSFLSIYYQVFSCILSFFFLKKKVQKINITSNVY